MDRVDEFLGERLRGRKVPADLRRIVEMQLDGQRDEAERVAPFCELRVLRAGEVHPLEEPIEPLPSDPYPEETRANVRAIAGVLAHVAPVLIDFDGALWGYWLHPEEPADVEPLIVKLDSEGEFRIVSGDSLIEGIVFDRAGDEDVSEIVAYCERHRIPFSKRSSDELPQVRPVVHPVALHDKLRKRFHPNHRRPSWADEPGAVPELAPIGARAGEPRVARALALHGLPDDPMPLIRATDVGEGEVVLQATRCTAAFEFHRENETAWFLHEMRFADTASDTPRCMHLPFGVELGETREQCHARLGEPAMKPAISSMERWSFGRVHLIVRYGKDDKVRSARYLAGSP